MKQKLIKKFTKPNQIKFLIILSCVILFVIEIIIVPIYSVKSVCKIVLFLGSILAFCIINKQHILKNLFGVKDKKKTTVAVLTGVFVVFIIFMAYYALKDIIDFTPILESLKGENISANNFIIISVYISVVNSFLEEVFFRGFGFMILKKYTGFWVANIFSAVMFSAYHIAIISSWFNPFLFVFVLAGLLVGGLVFNYIDYKYNSIIPSWIVHFSVNVAINTIGVIMFMTQK